MIEKAIATIDRDERFKIYREIQQKIDEICPSLYLFEQAQKQAYQASYIDWPAAKGKSVPIMGYDFAARFIQIYPFTKDFNKPFFPPHNIIKTILISFGHVTCN